MGIDHDLQWALEHGDNLACGAAAQAERRRRHVWCSSITRRLGISARAGREDRMWLTDVHCVPGAAPRVRPDIRLD